MRFGKSLLHIAHLENAEAGPDILGKQLSACRPNFLKATELLQNVITNKECIVTSNMALCTSLSCTWHPRHGLRLLQHNLACEPQPFEIPRHFAYSLSFTTINVSTHSYIVPSFSRPSHHLLASTQTLPLSRPQVYA